MMDITVLVVIVLYELRLTIEKVRKDYVQSKLYKINRFNYKFLIAVAACSIVSCAPFNIGES
jgi:hypothetical protein